MGRAPCCDKTKVKRGPWSPEEDNTLKNYLETYGTGGNWIALPRKAGLKRCGKSCRLRWLNYLRPNIKHGGFTEEEDNIILALYQTIGSRWSVIASQLPGRTDNDVKNYWNTKLKKKLLAAAGTTTTTSSSSSATTTAATSDFIIPTNSFDFAPGGNSNFMPYYYPVDQGMVATDQIPLPGLMEIHENNAYNSYGSLFSCAPLMSDEATISSLSPSISSAQNSGSFEDDMFLKELGYGSMPYGLTNTFDFQENLAYSMGNASNTEEGQQFHQNVTY